MMVIDEFEVVTDPDASRAGIADFLGRLPARRGMAGDHFKLSTFFPIIRRYARSVDGPNLPGASARNLLAGWFRLGMLHRLRERGHFAGSLARMRVYSA